jgi:hypothetical protein
MLSTTVRQATELPCFSRQSKAFFAGATCGDGVVPIRGFLAGRIFDAQAINEMSLAFDDACDELGLVNSAHDPATSLVAEKIIEVAQRGVHDPDQLRRMALNELGRG